MNHNFVSVILGGFGGEAGPAMESRANRSPSMLTWPPPEQADEVIINPQVQHGRGAGAAIGFELTRKLRARNKMSVSRSTRSPVVCQVT